MESSKFSKEIQELYLVSFNQIGHGSNMINLKNMTLNLFQ